MSTLTDAQEVTLRGKAFDLCLEAAVWRSSQTWRSTNGCTREERAERLAMIARNMDAVRAIHRHIRRRITKEER